MKKKIFPAVLIGILVLIIVGLSVKIETVTITGNSRYTDEEMEEMFFPDGLSRNSIYAFIKSLTGNKKNIPFVEDYKLNFDSPVSVNIVVYEKSVVGYVSYMSSNMYFDKDGIIVESTSQNLPGIPMIQGLNFGKILLYEPLPVEDPNIFDAILNLTQALSSHEIYADNIRFDSSKNAMVEIGDIKVELGDSDNINGKVSELSDILPKLEGKSGTLYLDTYDPSNSDLIYSFIPSKTQ